MSRARPWLRLALELAVLLAVGVVVRVLLDRAGVHAWVLWWSVAVIGGALVVRAGASARLGGVHEISGTAIDSFPVRLPVDRVAVGPLLQLRLLPRYRRWYSPGMLGLTSGWAEFFPSQSCHSHLAWQSSVSAVQLRGLLGRSTIIRVHGASGTAQFAATMPPDQVRAALEPALPVVDGWTTQAPSVPEPAGFVTAPAVTAPAVVIDPADVAAIHFEASALDVGVFTGWGPSRFPDARDLALDAYLRELRTCGSAGVADVLGSVSETGRNVFCVYAERAATRAVRSRKRELLVLGSIAAVMGGLDQGIPEAQMPMVLLEDAAARIGVGAGAVFEEAAKVVGDAAGHLRDWTDRPAATRTLDAMGYAPSSDSDGFCYEFTNW